MTTFDMNRITHSSLNPKIDMYAIYLRKSRADIDAEALGEGETLARHKKILTELAARKGLYIGGIYQELVSGDTIDARPEIQKLINDCYAGKYKGILIVEVTRLSRGNQGDAQTIMDCLRYSNMNNGVLVITPTKTYDIAHSQEDEEYMEFELFMSRREYKMIHKRMERGRRQAVVEGNFMGTYRPYGYNIVKTRTGRTLIPNENEAPIIKQIFEWTVKDNLTTFEIAKRLTAMGVPTYKGDRDWSKDSVKEYLRNPVYMGKVKWNNRMRIKTMVNGELKITRPRFHTDQYMLYEGKHKKHALVDDETFKKAQERFHSDRSRAHLKLINPLAGLIFCKKCGRAITYQPYAKTRADRYIHKQTTSGCKVKSAIATDVIDAVTHGLKMYMEDFEMKIKNTPDIDEHSVELKIDALKKEIKKIEKKKAKLFDSWEDEDITNNEFVERKAVHNQRIAVLEQQIEELETAIPEKEEYREALLRLTDAFIGIRDDELEISDKNHYLKKIVKRIEFSRENDDEFIIDLDLY